MKQPRETWSFISVLKLSILKNWSLEAGSWMVNAPRSNKSSLIPSAAVYMECKHNLENWLYCLRSPKPNILFRFRWVELQLSAFLGPNASINSPEDAREKLNKLESQIGLPELDEIYEEIYQMNTKPDLPSRGVAVRIYKWVLQPRE